MVSLHQIVIVQMRIQALAVGVGRLFVFPHAITFCLVNRRVVFAFFTGSKKSEIFQNL